LRVTSRGLGDVYKRQSYSIGVVGQSATSKFDFCNVAFTMLAPASFRVL
jgi:hypothetical protein